MKELTIFNNDGRVMVSSRKLAKDFGKDHDKVNRGLKAILKQTPNVANDIIESEYNDRGRMCKEYLLTKDGFTLYMFNIQGYNDFKMAYINKFNQMEQSLQQLTTPSYQIEDPIERAKRWIEEQEDKKQLEFKNEEQSKIIGTHELYWSIRRINAHYKIKLTGIDGKKMTRLSKARGFEVIKIIDGLYGSVNSYHVDIIKEHLQELKETMEQIKLF